MTERFTEQVLQELLEAKSLDDFIGGHEFSAGSLAEFLDQMLRKKGLKRSRVVRIPDFHRPAQSVAQQGAADRLCDGAQPA